MLANRYSQILPTLVHTDQNGFVPGRSSSQNLCRLFQMIAHVSSSFPRAACLILDLEKAFDTLSWDYLFRVLQRSGISPHILAYTKHLYTTPTSRIRLGHLISPSFGVGRSTRQGCPVSSTVRLSDGAPRQSFTT